MKITEGIGEEGKVLIQDRGQPLKLGVHFYRCI